MLPAISRGSFSDDRAGLRATSPYRRGIPILLPWPWVSGVVARNGVLRTARLIRVYARRPPISPSYDVIDAFRPYLRGVLAHPSGSSQ